MVVTGRRADECRVRRLSNNKVHVGQMGQLAVKGARLTCQGAGGLVCLGQFWMRVT